MLIVSSVLWAGWLVLAVSAGIGPHAGRDAIIKQRTAQFRANEALTHETHRGSLSDRLDDLERLSGSLANRFQELEKQVDELKRFQGTSAGHEEKQNVVRQGNTAIVTGKSAFAVASSRPQHCLEETAQSVAFDHIITNKGGDFHLNNNTFLCRIPGFYHFSFTLRTYIGMVIYVAMMKNDEQLVGINTDQSDRSVSSTQTTILQLSEGDSVWLRMPPADFCAIYSDDAHYTTFNGFLLYATTS